MAEKRIYDHLPRAVSHVIDNESKTETLGFSIFYGGWYAAVKLGYGAEFLLWCIVFSSILVGGRFVGKSILEAMALKLGGKTPDPKEVKTDALAPAASPQPA